MSYQEESLAPPATLYAPGKEESSVVPSAEQEAVRERRHASNVLVAAAGSGKTRVLTWLYTDAHLKDGVPLEALLAISFTDKAAGELRHRIAAELAKASLTGTVDLADAWIGTFHGICARILREFAHRAGLDPAFGVIEELQSLELQAEAWDGAVAGLLDEHGGDAASLISQVGDRALRAAIIEWWTARRSSGEVHPELPTPQTSAADVGAAAQRLLRACDRYAAAVDDVQSARANPSKSLVERLEITEEIATHAQSTAELAVADDLGPVQVAALQAALEARKPRAGNPMPPDHEELAQLLDARTALVRRLAEHVAAPRVLLLADLVRRFSHGYEAAKRRHELLDFDDLELEALQLLREDDDVRVRLVERFERILVDEFQDTNPRQAELVDYLAGGPMWIPIGGDGRPAVTVVGDPRQSIYGFRHADVQLISGAADRIDAEGTLRLSTNYRSDAEVLSAIDEAFAKLDPSHEPVNAHRGPDRLPAGQARVEMLITKEEPGTRDAPLPTWTDVDLGARIGEKSGAALAEARLIAVRIQELRAAEPDRSITVLGRARSVLFPIAEALGDLEIPALIDGAEGFWERLEVADVMAWLRLVRNPADDAALIAVCTSPLVGLSTDAVATLGLLTGDRTDGGRAAALQRELTSGGAFGADDAARLRGLFALLRRQREPGRAADPAGLIDELVEATAYDEHLLRLIGGDRRAANIVRLRRLAGEIASRGGDLTDVVERAEKEQGHELRAPEASVAGSGAVVLMTVHQSKGLEFDTVIVAGLGSQQRLSTPALIGAPKGDDRRLGLRLRPSPGAPAQSLFDHDELVDELRAREDEELRRVLYVALTRAKERLIVSGLARWTQKGSPFSREPSRNAAVLTWLAPAMAPEIDAVIEQASEGPVRTSTGIELRVSTPEGPTLPAHLRAPAIPDLTVHVGDGPQVDRLPHTGPPALTAPRGLSFSALDAHARCGLRFYAERVLGLRPVEEERSEGVAWPDARSTPSPAHAAGVQTPMAAVTGALAPGAPDGSVSYASEKAPVGQDDLFSFLDEPATPGPPEPAPAPAVVAAAASGISANLLGSAVHLVLERVGPDSGAVALDQAVAAATADAIWEAYPQDRASVRVLAQRALAAPAVRELWAAGPPRRESAFAFAVGDSGCLLTGKLDAWALLPGGDAIVVDYKTNRVEAGEDLAAKTAREYGLQQRVYALAALRAGAHRVRVVHLYLRAETGGAIEVAWDASTVDELDRELAGVAAAVDTPESRVPTPDPNRFTCDGCPARGTLCAWPVEATLAFPTRR